MPLLKTLEVPANLTFTRLCPILAQPHLEQLVLAPGSVYTNADRAHQWLSSVWSNATIEDRS
jgi:hypothetical protein